jgi:tetratricopeptide (TPR) repeat protein
MRRASALLEKMVAVHPNNPELLAEYASGLASLGDHYGGIGVGKAVDEAQSVNCYTRELAVWRQVAGSPSVTPALSLRARRGMAIACMKLGNVARAAGRFEEALGRYRQAAGTLRQLPPAEQATTTSVRLRVAIAKGTADSLTALSRPEEALATLDQELEEARRLQSADPENRQSSASMLLLFKSRGDLHKAAGRRDAALADYRSAEEIAAKTLAEDPANKVNQGRLEDLRALIAGTASMRTAPKGAR